MRLCLCVLPVPSMYSQLFLRLKYICPTQRMEMSEEIWIYLHVSNFPVDSNSMKAGRCEWDDGYWPCGNFFFFSSRKKDINYVRLCAFGQVYKIEEKVMNESYDSTKHSHSRSQKNNKESTFIDKDGKYEITDTYIKRFIIYIYIYMWKDNYLWSW